MSRTKYDYRLLEREYVTSDVSIRQLCLDHNIPNWSTVSVQAKKLEWDRKRAEYKEVQFQHDINALAQKRAMRFQQTFDDALDALDAAILKMAENLKSPTYVVTPADLAKLIEKLSLLAGGPTSREEVHTVNLDLPADLLRELQAAARTRGAGLEPVGQSALPIAAGPRKVN